MLSFVVSDDQILQLFVRSLRHLSDPMFGVLTLLITWRKLSIIWSSSWSGMRVLNKEEKDTAFANGRLVSRHGERSNFQAVGGIVFTIYTTTCAVYFV